MNDELRRVTPLQHWLSLSQAARRLGYSGEYTRQLILNNKLRAIRVVLGYLIDPLEVDRFDEARSRVGHASVGAQR